MRLLPCAADILPDISQNLGATKNYLGGKCERTSGRNGNIFGRILSRVGSNQITFGSNQNTFGRILVYIFGSNQTTFGRIVSINHKKSPILPSVVRLLPCLADILPEISHNLGAKQSHLGGECQQLEAIKPHLGGYCHHLGGFFHFLRVFTYLSQKHQNVLGYVCYIFNYNTKTGGGLGGLCETAGIYGLRS